MHDGAVVAAYERWLLQLAQSSRAPTSQISGKPLILFPLDPTTGPFLASYAPDARLSGELAASHFGIALRLCAAHEAGGAASGKILELLQRVLAAIDTETATVEDLQLLLCCCAVAPASFLQDQQHQQHAHAHGHGHGLESVAAMLLRTLDQPSSSLVRGRSVWR